MTVIVWLRNSARGARLGLVCAACLGVAVGTLAVGAPAGGAPAGRTLAGGTPAGDTPAAEEETARPSNSGGVVCPSSNPPITPSGSAGKPAKVTAGVGAMQSTPVGARFPIRLAVTVTDAEKDPVPGALVTFSAPARGPSGRFATRGRRRHSVTVKTDACGVAVAPAFTANDEQGGYIVKASVEHVRPAAFALVNAGPGQQP
jgi:hypothetical protein